MNPQPGFGTPDAYLTGDLYRRLKMIVQGGNYTLESDSPHAALMIKRDGPAIFGLQDTSIQRYREEAFYPLAQRKIKEITGLP